MKIVILLPGYFEENFGGAELQSKYLAQACINNYYDVYYIFLSTRREFSNPLNINLFPINKKNIFIKLNNIKYPYFLPLIKTLKYINPDVIYNRTASALTGIAAYYAKRHCQLIFHIASDKDLEHYALSFYNFYLLLEKQLIQYGINKANKVIAQSNFQAEQLKINYNKQATIISNGHPIPDTCSKISNKIKIIWIANWKPIKQPEIFVKLAKELSYFSNIEFNMIGRIGNYNTLADEAQNHGIDVKGVIPNEEVNELLAQGHILVNTSKQEGFSNTFIQAWMRKVPVVSLQVDPDGILENKGIGFCSGSFEQLVLDTKKLVEDLQLLESMGDKARKYGIKHHSLDNMDRIIEIINS